VCNTPVHSPKSLFDGSFSTFQSVGVPSTSSSPFPSRFLAPGSPDLDHKEPISESPNLSEPRWLHDQCFAEQNTSLNGGKKKEALRQKMDSELITPP
ncbi:unnamed protein product, partial [Protopolystoma xenopodis]